MNICSLLIFKQNYNVLSTSLSQFLHSYICERFIYLQDRSFYFSAAKYVDRSWEYKSLTDMNVEFGTEAAQFPEKKYINGIFFAV